MAGILKVFHDSSRYQAKTEFNNSLLMDDTRPNILDMQVNSGYSYNPNMSIQIKLRSS